MSTQPPEGSSPGSQPNPQQPVTPQAVPDYRGYPPPGPAPRRRPRWGLWILLLLFLSGVVVLFGGLAVGVASLAALASIEPPKNLREEHVSHNEDAFDKIAILQVEGLISEYDGFVKKQIDQIRDDNDVKAVVLRINSPGGTVAASDYLYHHMKEMARQRELPVVVSMGAIAASGGYYTAMAVGDTPQSIFAEPATWTGSIGVIIPHYNLHEMLDRWGIENDSIASGPLKDMGNLSKPMTEEEREVFRGLVDASFERFKEVIREGRPKLRANPEKLDAVATGQVFTAGQAVDNGLVDQLGFREDAVERAIELAGLNPARVNVIRYKQQPTLASLLMEAQASPPRLDPSRLLDLASPQAFYLYTWTPGLLDPR